MKNRFMKSEFFKKGFIKKICLALLITGFALGLHSQAWKKNIKKKNPDFFTIKAAFEKACKGKDIKTINGWKQFKRWEWFMENRVNEAGYLDSMKLWEAIKVKKRRFSGSKQSISDWSEIGPRDIPSGGGLGRINCIAFDPDDSDTMWIASPSGGLWKTTDAGSNWSTRTDDLPNIGVSWILIDPEDSDIMYIATGDGDGGDTYSVGVLKSTDGGDSWDTTGLQGDITSYWLIRKMLFYPGNSHTIIAATDGGIFKTTDGGTSWTETQAGYFRDIEVNASSPNIWYASVSWNGIFKSTDGGDSWAKVGSGLPVTGFQRIELDISPSTPTTIYALYCDDDNNGFFGIYRSTDSGSTWTRQASSPNLLGWAYNGDDTGGQGYYDLTLAVNPTNADEIYVGGVNLWKSSDAGVSWVCIAHWYGNGGRPYVHADHHFLEFQPGSSSVLFSGNDGGICLSTDSGTSWSDISNGLGIHQIYRMGGSQSLEADIVIGTQDNGSDLLTNGTGPRILGGDGMECAIDPEDPNTMYCEYYYGTIFRSTTHGSNMTYIGYGLDYGAWVTPFQIAPDDHETLYLGASYVYKSTNRGTDWTPISPLLSNDNIRSLAVAPSNSDYIYAADRSTINVTTNGGTSWRALSGGSVPVDFITYLAVDPESPTTVWVTRGGYTDGEKVFRSTNGGTSWTNISGALPNIPVNCVVVDHTSPHSNKPVYIGTDLGVFSSQDGNGLWEAFDNGLPNVIVNELEIHTSSRKLRAATYGRGMWETPLAAFGETIYVTRPNGGENWVPGTTQSITWTSNDITGAVTIELYKGGFFDSAIGTTGVSVGSYSWAIPSGQAHGTDYKVRIYQGNIGDYSNANFGLSDKTLPEIYLSRTTLNFGATEFHETSPQEVYIYNSGVGILSWAVSTDQTWLSCTPSSGSQSGVLTVSVSTAGFAAGTYTGTVTVSDPLAVNSPLTIAVILTVINRENTALPFGEFSTPSDGTTASGSIALTGWVLDDIEVTAVHIYNGIDLVGEASFVEGARPDIEQAYPNHPNNHKAGWGYMLLTHFLPGGGNGTYTLNVYADDAEFHTGYLGTKRITVSNDAAVKPFGAIDTPAQGGSASGNAYINHGWVLTPMPNKIPEDGSSIDVYMDGVYIGKPLYNFARSDIATLFPGYANSSGPAARFSLNTLDFLNGVHTIYWIAADNAGNADGIGSRFFTIKNSGSIAPPESLASLHLQSPYSPAINTASLAGIPALSSPIAVITGCAKESSPEVVRANKNGVAYIRVKELERVVVVLDSCDRGACSGCSGYMVAGNQLRPLPIGSTLDAKKGVFYWHPGPGFAGTYTFLFIINKNGQQKKQVFQVEIGI